MSRSRHNHVIPDEGYFCEAVERAYRSNQPMVTFGVKPTRPETGYGYIQTGELICDSGLAKVERFVEKPDLATAKQYLDEAGHLWNSGMFLLEARTYLDELAKYNPEMLAACEEAIEKSKIDLDFCRVDIVISLLVLNAKTELVVFTLHHQSSINWTAKL